MTFPCTKCGACCKRAWVIADKFIAAGIPLTPSGACSLLVDNKCSVYEDRPPFCRIDGQCPPGMPEKAYYELTAGLCNIYQEEDGIPKRFRVHLWK